MTSHKFTIEQRQTTSRAKNVRYAMIQDGWARPLLLSHEDAVHLFTQLGEALALPLPPIQKPKQCTSETRVVNGTGYVVVQCQDGEAYHGLRHRYMAENGAEVSWW
jgi:hypothetical protein